MTNRLEIEYSQISMLRPIDYQGRVYGSNHTSTGVEYSVGIAAGLRRAWVAGRDGAGAESRTFDTSGSAGHVGENEFDSPSTILVVDDERAVAESHVSMLSSLHFRAESETNPSKVEETLSRRPDIGLVILDIRMPQMNGSELLKRIRSKFPQVGVIMATVVNDIEEAVRATRSGAYNYLLKPLHPDRLNRVVRSFLENRPKRLNDDPRCQLFITNSPLCSSVFRHAKAFAASDAPVLIQGETGAGKELIAHIIHLLSDRNAQRFVGVNVAALSPTLFESELFGHVRGAFTGAIKDREGYFAHAGSGTLFLDEIGELSPEQ
jgi:DNA-binding NtrC family response regulator